MKKIKIYTDILAVIVFVAVMMAVPWAELQGFQYGDLLVYRDYFLHQENVLDYVQLNSISDYLSNEVLWHYAMNTVINSWGVPIDLVFPAITVFCLSVFGFFLARRQGALSLVLLMNPLMVDFAFQQLRLGVAYSLVLLGYMSGIRLLAVLLVIVASFIHTSIALFVFVYIAVWLTNKTLVDKSKLTAYIALCLIGISLSVAIGPLRELILSFFGDRRAHMGDAESSVLYTLFWVGLLALFAFQSKAFFKDEVNCYSIVILSLVSANLLTGGYTSRFLSVALPMTMSSMLRMGPQTRIFALVAFTGYVIFQWSYWLGASLRV